VGLSSTDHFTLRDSEKTEDWVNSESLNEIEHLTYLLSPSAGNDARALARKLIKRHGSFGSIILKAGSGGLDDPLLSETAWKQLSSFSKLIMAGWESEALKGEVISTSKALISYLRFDMGREEREFFRVLFLDATNRLIEDRWLWEGTVNEVHAYPREIVRIALELSSTAMILVHNHPNGDPAPSIADYKLTQRIQNACSTLDLAVHDHVIVANGGAFSMRSNSLIHLD
jgi:DNA repair protein RadC